MVSQSVGYHLRNSWIGWQYSPRWGGSVSDRYFSITPVARQIPFDPTGTSFTSTDTENAIIEASLVGSTASRGPTVCGFDGTASSGRWLEFFSNNPSNNNPFIIAEPAALIAVSLVTSAASATGTVTIYKNGSSIHTISLTAQKKNAISGLLLSLISLDELSLQVTTGSIPRPSIYMFIRTIL